MSTEIKSAYEAIEAAIHGDPEYAWGWHCNIAMPIMDEMGCSHEEANRTASRLMGHLFNYDIERHHEWLRFEVEWKRDAA